MGVAFAEVSPDFRFCINTRRHRSAVLLPPVGFAIVTLVVCMLAAWEWGSLAALPRALSGYGWRYSVVLLALMLYTLPEYHHDVHQPLVAGSLWISLARWIAALVLVLFYPGSAAIWRNSKVLRLIFGLLTIVPFSGDGCAAHYDENHYSGAIWLLYVMILVWGLTPGPICLVNCSANINWRQRFLRAKPARLHWRPVYGSDYLRAMASGRILRLPLHAAGMFDFRGAGIGAG